MIGIKEKIGGVPEKELDELEAEPITAEEDKRMDAFAVQGESELGLSDGKMVGDPDGSVHVHIGSKHAGIPQVSSDNHILTVDQILNNDKSVQGDERVHGEIPDVNNRSVHGNETVHGGMRYVDDGGSVHDSCEIDYEKCRKELVELFFKKVFIDRTWKLFHSFKIPRKGKDKELDALLDTLQLADKRGYAATKWREFKKDKGISPPPRISSDKAHLRSCYDNRIASCGREQIVSDAIAEQIRCQSDWQPDILPPEKLQFIRNSIDQQTWVQLLLMNEVDKFSMILADNMAGATSKTAERRSTLVLLGFDNFRKIFLCEIRNKLTVRMEDAEIINLFFGELHNLVRNQWEKAIRDHHLPELVKGLDDEDIRDAITGSEGSIYNVAGFLLKMLDGIGDASDKKIRSKFIAANSISKVDASMTTLPTQKVDQFEKKSDALHRSSAAWYRLIAMLEALYVVNLTPENVMLKQGKIIEYIGISVIRKSDDLRIAFAKCFPEDFTQREGVMLFRRYFINILPCYQKLKAKDVIQSVNDIRRQDTSARQQMAHRSTLSAGTVLKK